MTKLYNARYDVRRIVHGLHMSTVWLSHSCRKLANGEHAEVEMHGTAVAVRQTARGLTVTLDTGKKVVWHCPQSLARQVVASYVCYRIAG